MNCCTLCLLWKMENVFISNVTKSRENDKTMRNRKVDVQRNNATETFFFVFMPTWTSRKLLKP